MALQDQPQNPASMIDPATGQPLEYGTPEYYKALAPWIQNQIKSSAEDAANARGTFYSGNAMADEIQAQAGALNAMGQEGSRQALQEKELAQQEAFAQQQQDKQNQANMDAAKSNAKGAMVGGAIQGVTGPLGTIAGMKMYDKMFGHGTPSIVPTPGAGAAPSVADAVSAANSGAAGSWTPAEVAGDFGDFSGGGGAATGSGGQIAVDGLTPAGAGMGALASLPAAYYGAKAGLRTFGDTPGNQVAAGVGGAAGGALGMLGGPLAPVLMPLGAAAGSFIGPGVAKGGQEAINWLGDRFHF